MHDLAHPVRYTNLFVLLFYLAWKAAHALSTHLLIRFNGFNIHVCIRHLGLQQDSKLHSMILERGHLTRLKSEQFAPKAV
jgi:hypothetical protein